MNLMSLFFSLPYHSIIIIAYKVDKVNIIFSTIINLLSLYLTNQM